MNKAKRKLNAVPRKDRVRYLNTLSESDFRALWRASGKSRLAEQLEDACLLLAFVAMCFSAVFVVTGETRLAVLLFTTGAVILVAHMILKGGY